MDPASERSASFAFGRFRVEPHRGELLADGRPIKLGGRAFDVLMALIEARGAVVGKRALMARVWSDRIVEENNLQSQISALRAAFGAERGLIRTVSGRGYQFTGDIRVLSASADERAGAGAAAAEAASAPAATNLPEPVSELIGREVELGEILSLAAAHRLVTLAGAGGIGKTRLALAAARQLPARFSDGAWVADLAPLSDPSLVPCRVAAAVGLELAMDTVSSEGVAHALSPKQLLLVLDNCEHVIDAAATMAEALLRANPMAHVIATSREPLNVEGEWVYPVPALALPAEDAEGGDDLLQYGAVRLFIDRARAAAPRFASDQRSREMIAAICRRLDGIPLAIELAAARAPALGIEALSAGLDDRFELLTSGRRTALARHQTLRAALDWSYALLDERNRVVLRRLSVFAGAFSLEAARAVVANGVAPSEVVDSLSDLVAKSLVTAEGDSGPTRFRLLDTTRTYALEKLIESGERERTARRHAEHYRTLFERAEAEAPARPSGEWLADYGREIDNLHAALDWAFSPGGYESIGVTLTAAAVPLWMRLSLLKECHSRAKQALRALENGRIQDPREGMRLHAALGASTPEAPEMNVALTKVLDIAERLGDAEYQLRALRGLYSYHTMSGRYRAALSFAQRFHDLAMSGSDQNYRLFGERMMGTARHFLGDQIGAQRHLEEVLTYAVTDHGRDVIRFQDVIRFGTDVRLSARVFLARVLWLQGFADQAVRTADISIGEAQATGHVVSLCHALALAACPIALWVGNLGAAANYTGMLLDHSRKHSLSFWRAYGSRFQRVLILRGGDLDAGLRLPQTGLDETSESTVRLRFLTGLSELADGLAHAQRIAEGLAVLEAGFQQFEAGWLTPELLRLKGELLLGQSRSAVAKTAEDLFRQALDGARRHATLSWELRAATSLARLLHHLDRSAEAKALIQPVYDRFTEGFDTADLKAAKEVIDGLRQPRLVLTTNQNSRPKRALR